MFLAIVFMAFLSNANSTFTSQAIELKSLTGKSDATLHLKSQIDQLVGRNDELRQELRSTREEAASTLSQLARAKEKV